MADFSDKWAVLFSEAPKELPDRNIHLIVIDMAAIAIKHIVKAYEPRIAVYGASLHSQVLLQEFVRLRAVYMLFDTHACMQRKSG